MIRQFWQSGQRDPAFPFPSATAADFEKFLESHRNLESMGWGALRQVMWQGRTAGMVKVQILESGLLPIGVQVAECGTYLLPEARGRGLNPRVKWETAQLAVETLAMDWCVFVVLTQNQQALHGLYKLNWPFVHTQGYPTPTPNQLAHPTKQLESIENAMDRPSNVPVDPLWIRFARWKAWQVQQQVHVFALHRDHFSQLSPPPIPPVCTQL